MKLTDNDVALLKSMRTIAQSVCFDAGNVVTVARPTGAVLAQCDLESDFPTDFAIYDYTRFLAALSMYQNVNLSFTDGHCVIADDDAVSTTLYRLTEQSLLSKPPKPEDIPWPDDVASFEITWDDIEPVIKAVNILGVDSIQWKGENGVINCRGFTANRRDHDQFSRVVGKCKNDFDVTIKVENFAIATRPVYNVRVLGDKAIHLDGSDIRYWIAVEA